MDRFAASCPCSCHGRGAYAECDPAYPSGCGHLHTSSAEPAGGCPACHRPVADHALCGSCTATLAGDLRQIPGLLVELDTYAAKLDQIGERAGRRSAEIPLGFRPMAAEVADVLHGTLAAWSRHVAGAAGVPLLDVPAESPALLAGWLYGWREFIRHLPAAGQLLDEVAYAVRTTRRAIDRPADQHYAGPCDTCETDLYAGQNAETVKCRECGALYPVPERRAWLLDGLREHLATAAEISQGIGDLYGQPINRNTITQWHRRELLSDHGRTRTGAPLFRIGDVLDLAGRRATRQAG